MEIHGKGRYQPNIKYYISLCEMIGVDTVICATDAGREGELIFRLTYKMAECKKATKRLWISSMEERVQLKMGLII